MLIGTSDAITMGGDGKSLNSSLMSCYLNWWTKIQMKDKNTFIIIRFSYSLILPKHNHAVAKKKNYRNGQLHCSYVRGIRFWFFRCLKLIGEGMKIWHK